MAENKRYIQRRQPTPTEAFTRAAEMADTLTDHLDQFTMEKGIAGPVDPIDAYRLAQCVSAIGRVLAIAAADAADLAGKTTEGEG